MANNVRQRTIYFSDSDLWKAATERAKAEKTSVSVIIYFALKDYVENGRRMEVTHEMLVRSLIETGASREQAEALLNSLGKSKTNP